MLVISYDLYEMTLDKYFKTELLLEISHYLRLVSEMIKTSLSAWVLLKQIAAKMLRVSSSIIVKYWEIAATRKLFWKEQSVWAGFQIGTLSLIT